MKNKEELLDEYISLINSKFKKNTKELFSIGFIGINGVGKSFIAEKISEKLGLYIANNDRMRRFLDDKGFEDVNLVQELVFDMGPKLSAYLYENKISHIIDADLMQFHNITRRNAKKYKAYLCIIHLICPEEIILSRIDKRSEDILRDSSSNFSRVGREEYFKRKKMHQEFALPEVFFTIDTSLNVDEQLNIFIDKLKKEKLI